MLYKLLALITLLLLSPSIRLLAQDAFTEPMLAKVFDDLWATMDKQYSYFFLKPEVNWARLKEEYRPKAIAARNAEELGKVLQEMLAHLKDGHVWIIKPDGNLLPTFNRVWNYNANGNVIMAELTSRVQCGQFAIVGKTKTDGFGYFLLVRQGSANAENVKQACEAIEKLRDAPGFIVDLRRATGGNEVLARQIASLFCAKTVVYAKSKIRSGPGHEDFGQVFDRQLPSTTEGKAYTKPVVCLIGPGAISSGEGFAKMMKALPNVTTIGLPTAGSSGNPGPIKLGNTGLTVYASRWVDMMPDGTVVEGKGVVPSIEVKVDPEVYRTADPTLEKGLETLREKVIGK
jgi:hypothetical protein